LACINYYLKKNVGYRVDGLCAIQAAFVGLFSRQTPLLKRCLEDRSALYSVM